MKKIVTLLILAGIFIGVRPLNAAVSTLRAIKCAIPRLHTKFNCTPKEKIAGKKWLVGVSIAAAAATLAAIITGGVKLVEIQKAKQ